MDTCDSARALAQAKANSSVHSGHLLKESKNGQSKQARIIDCVRSFFFPPLTTIIKYTKQHKYNQVHSTFFSVSDTPNLSFLSSEKTFQMPDRVREDSQLLGVLVSVQSQRCWQFLHYSITFLVEFC